jgi:mannosyltransferase OCH1-like enzyme
MTVASFIKYHPDYTINFYYPKNINSVITWSSNEQKYGLQCKCYRDELQKFKINHIPIDFDTFSIPHNTPEVLRSDVLRLYLLSSIGGLWSDMDILYINSLDALKINADIVLCCDLKYRVMQYSIGLLMGVTDNAFFKHLYDCVQKYINLNVYQSLGSSMFSTEFCSLQKIQNTFPGIRIHNLPMHIIYPYDSYHINKLYMYNEIPNHTVGIHWYAGHELSGRYQNIITKDNYMHFNNVVCNAIKRINQS